MCIYREDSDISVWKSVGRENSFGRRERSRSPRDFDDKFMSSSRSPTDFRERKRRYSDERSVDDYKRSYPKRSISPRHREPSPKYNYDSLRHKVEYDDFPRKSDLRDRLDYIPSRYEHKNHQEYVKRAFDSRDRQQSP